MYLDKNRIPECFPFEELRDGQQEALEFIINSYNKGKRIVLLEAPTGSGKSVLGMTMANFFDKSYYITIQKILQEQILKDFAIEHEVESLKGRANYPCDFYEREGQNLLDKSLISKDKLKKLLAENINCTNGHCRKRLKKFKCQPCFTNQVVNGKEFGSLKKLPEGMVHSACPYYEQVGRVINSHTAIFNFSSFLYQTAYAQNRFGKRDLLIVDECHNTEPELLKFTELRLNDRILREYHYSIPEFKLAEEYYVHFRETGILDVIEKIILDAANEENIKLQDEYTTLMSKIGTFMRSVEEENEWVVEYTDLGDICKVELKPVFIRDKTEDQLLKYADRALFMSATILDVNVFCDSLGIDRSEVAAFRMKNRFPKENRQIHIHSYGEIKGGKSKQHEWGPGMIKAANEVISYHPGEKGIIHTHNFAIAKMLREECSESHRFLFQHDFDNDKDEMLRVHARSQDSIIVAPAMHEGLDLKDDLSRFQIIAKVPYPNFFEDKQLARRVEIDKKYYNWLVALKLVQSYGRSIRSDSDYADTYVLDKNFLKFIKYNKKMLPKWFLEVVNA
jgi:Rad3-related DNA helicase